MRACVRALEAITSRENTQRKDLFICIYIYIYIYIYICLPVNNNGIRN